MVESLHDAQRRGAEDLVIRARCGDQVAMAIIHLAAINANHSELARTGSYYIREYIERNPIVGNNAYFHIPIPTSIHGDYTVNRAANILADGPLLSRQRIAELISFFGPRRSYKRQSVIEGITNFGKTRFARDSVDRALFDYGRSIGYARGIQICRTPKGRISNLCRIAAWELGE